MKQMVPAGLKLKLMLTPAEIVPDNASPSNTGKLRVVSGVSYNSIDQTPQQRAGTQEADGLSRTRLAYEKKKTELIKSCKKTDKR